MWNELSKNIIKKCILEIDNKPIQIHCLNNDGKVVTKHINKEDKSDACEFISSITGDNSRNAVSYGTEAGLFQEIGISSVVCGPGSIEQAHKVDEFIELNELKKCLRLLEGIKNKSILK